MYGETVLEVVGDQPQKLEWPGYGFCIEVPKGALPPGVTVFLHTKLIYRNMYTYCNHNFTDAFLVAFHNFLAILRSIYL